MPKRHSSPYDWITPEERLRRIIELLATAAVRVVQEESVTPTKEPPSPLTTHGSLRAPTKGRIPYGEQKTPVGRTINPLEDHWLKRIRALAADSLSSEEIAKRLNLEDRKSKRNGKWSRTTVWRILQKAKKKVVTK